jgi:plasmid stabilization system protein ParE
MRLVFLKSARADLQWFQRYYGYVFTEGARQAGGQYLTCRKILRENPFIGHKIEDSDYREFPITRTPFVFVYRIRGEEVQVLRIWDARGNPDEKLL